LRVLVLIGLWRTILGDSAAAGPMPLAAVLTYTVIGEVFAEQLAVRTTLPDAFWEGTLVLRFLRPMSLVGQLTAETMGRWGVHLALFSIPLLVVAPLIGVDPRPASVASGGLFVLSLTLGIVVGLAIECLFAIVTVALDQPVWLVNYVRVALATLLSGSLLPLAYYPWGLGEMFAWLPPAAMAWAPLAVYTAAAEPALLLTRQLGWAIVLWPVAGWLWRQHREKLASYGG